MSDPRQHIEGKEAPFRSLAAFALKHEFFIVELQLVENALGDRQSFLQIQEYFDFPLTMKNKKWISNEPIPQALR